MALKAKKVKKQVSGDKDATITRPWPDLPQQLLQLISRQSTLMQRISYRGVTKSWRASPRQCNTRGKSPWPQLSDDGDHVWSDDKSHPNFFNISFHHGCIWWYGRKPPEYCYYHWTHFVGYCYGLLVTRGKELCLCEPNKRISCRLPPWDDNIPIKFITLSSSLKNAVLSARESRHYRIWGGFDVDCIVLVLTGICSPAFVYHIRYGRGELEWKSQDCTVIDPYGSDQQFMKFSNVIHFEGKFYALSLQGTLAVIKFIDSRLSITSISTSRAVPSVFSKHFREYLVESDGEILLVFLISTKSMNLVDDVEVFRLEFSRLAWVKMESLGDRTLFAGANCFISVSASKVGCRRNCIYFTHKSADGWWVYEMESGSISAGWDTAESVTKSPVWDQTTTEE
ncbi:unnamed protein product [Ilex paraguariensis]|uniref:KIB1-4 beta-propeller domain-containing protein n=1 Tax=Ilex paraguariensis TaxID=185542 RepID=A0ABC8S137_9AQUA